MDNEFFARNRRKIIKEIKDQSIVVLFSGHGPHKSADAFYPFTVNRNFFYLSGIDRENMILVMEKRTSKVQETLFIEKRDPVLEKWVGKRMTEEEARAASAVETIRFVDDFKSYFNRLMISYPYENIYLDLERRGWDEPFHSGQAFSREMGEKYPSLKIYDVYHTICKQRMVKSGEEIDRIRKAIDITKDGVLAMMKNARPGMKEYQLEAYFDFTLKTSGIKEHAFKTIAASGINGTVLHYEDNNSMIGDDSLILFDLGAQYEYYNADISRTFPVSGKFTERQKEIYNIVLKAQYETMKAIRPGTPFQNLNIITKQVFAEECKRIGLIQKDEELSKYYYHGVSHSLGLDTHDVGSTDGVLEPGMVITVEPGLYIEDESIGIRIEDDVLVTEEGHEVLSRDLIKTIEDIEAFMAK